MRTLAYQRRRACCKERFVGGYGADGVCRVASATAANALAVSLISSIHALSLSNAEVRALQTAYIHPVCIASWRSLSGNICLALLSTIDQRKMDQLMCHYAYPLTSDSNS